MWKLYLQTIHAKTLPELDQVITIALKYYQDRASYIRYQIPKLPSYHGGTNLLLPNHQITDFNHQDDLHVFEFLLPSIIKIFQGDLHASLQLIFSYSFDYFSFPQLLRHTVSVLHLPKQIVSPLVYIFYGSFKCIITRFSYGSIDPSFLDFLLSSTSVSALHFLADWFISFISTYLPIASSPFIRFGISLLLSKLIEELNLGGIIYKIKQSLDFFPFWVTNLFIREHPVNMGEVNLLPSLICPICYDLLNKPVESLGFFFCESCIENWQNEGGSTHPVTGESITNNFLRRSPIFDLILVKYKNIIASN